MADRTMHLLLEHSDITRYAAVVGTQLASIASNLGYSDSK